MDPSLRCPLNLQSTNQGETWDLTKKEGVITRPLLELQIYHIGWIKRVGVLNLSSYFPENDRRIIKMLSHPSYLFEI